MITSGVGLGSEVPGELATEDVFNADFAHPRKLSEIGGITALERGANVSVVRLPQVHDPYKQGLITYWIGISRAKSTVAYIGEGMNRWSAAHVSDVARLYRLALERQEAGSRYHAVAEEGVTAKEIAEVLGRGLNLPVVSVSAEEAPAHFGRMAGIAGLDLPASSALTQERLGWKPTGPGLIADLEEVKY